MWHWPSYTEPQIYIDIIKDEFTIFKDFIAENATL